MKKGKQKEKIKKKIIKDHGHGSYSTRTPTPSPITTHLHITKRILSEAVKFFCPFFLVRINILKATTGYIDLPYITPDALP